jgi:hypothetical protein
MRAAGGLSGLRLGIGAGMALAAMLLAPPAKAQLADQPMTFEWGSVFGDTPAIFADGEFTPETPDALKSFLRRSRYSPDTRIYLNSTGGDLSAGMAVGRIIREAHLNTGVATNARRPPNDRGIDLHAYSRVYPGYCISACTLAFLGGVARHVEIGATFAVHQVSMDCVDKASARSRFPWLLLPDVRYCPDLTEALSMLQVANGEIVEYVRTMGADPVFLTEMSKAGPQTLNALTEEKLNAYRINFTHRSLSWSYETDAQGQFFLRHTQGDEWKEDRLEFFCDRTSSPRLLMWLVHDTRRSRGREDAQGIVDLASGGLSLFWQLATPGPDGFSDVRNVRLEKTEIITPPTVSPYGNVTMTIDISKRFLDVLTTARSVQLTTTTPEPDSVTGFNLISLDLDRDKIAGMVRSCGGSAP